MGPEDQEAFLRKYLPDGIKYEDLGDEAKHWFWNLLAAKFLPAKRRGWEDAARPKQLPPDHPGHHKPFIHPKSGKIYRCEENNPTCTGVHKDWEVWLFLAGRGCLGGHTRIYLPLEDRHERIDVLTQAGHPITILALTDDGPVPARTDGPPFLKGVADLYEVRTDDNQVITVTDQHRFLTPQGWQRLADVREGQLLASGAPAPPAEPSSPSGLLGGARRSTRTDAGSRGNYPRYPCSDGLPLPAGSGNGRVPSPSPAGAGGHNLLSWPADDQGDAQECNHPHPRHNPPARMRSSQGGLSLEAWPTRVQSVSAGWSLHPIPGDPPFPGMTFPWNEVPAAHSPGYMPGVSLRSPASVSPYSPPGTSGPLLLHGAAALSSAETARSALQFPDGFPLPGNVREFHPVTPEASSYKPYLDFIRWTRVLSITPAGTDVFYDMTVPGAGNYAAEGMWQKNTGKTMAGSNWILSKALSVSKGWVGVCAPTFADVKNVCFEGPSGIINQAERGDIVDYNKNGLKVTLKNDSVIQGYSAEKPDSIRGANLSACWFDELAMIRYQSFYEAGLQPALRIGDNPQLMITTTPKRTKLIRRILNDCENKPARYHLTQAVTEENPYYADVRIRDLRERFAGTFLEKQELEGILVDEVDGALFSMEILRDNYIGEDELPELRQIIVAIDPSNTSEKDSDETGIIIAAEGMNHHGYLLADCSLRGTPKQCMQRAVAAFYHYDADCVIGERNNVGDYMRETINTIDPNVPFMPVWAQRGKSMRAQPVSILSEQGKIHFVGNPGDFTELENQLCAMSVDDDRGSIHDDRADAFVWAFRMLKGMSEGSYKEAYGFFDCPKCGAQMNQKDRACKSCGHGNPENTVVRPRHETRWAGVYMNTCHTCSTTYPTHVRKCPKCNLNPESYLKAAAGGQVTDWKTIRGRKGAGSR